jgi:COMPASS component SWD2
MTSLATNFNNPVLYVPGKVLPNPNNEENVLAQAMDVSHDGQRCVTAWRHKDQMGLYNLLDGQEITVSSRNLLGANHVRFVHSNTVVATAARTGTGIHRRLSIFNFHDNKQVRQFPGHGANISSLNCHPYVDMIMSAGDDKRVCLWDLRESTNRPLKQIILRGCTSPCANFDPKGVAFAIASSESKGSSISLFDIRKVADGAFDTFAIDALSEKGFHDIHFSPDGKKICVTQIQDGGKAPHWLLDSFTGRLVGSLTEHHVSDAELSDMKKGSYSGPMYTSFSPDSNYMVGGSLDGTLRIWSIQDDKCAQVGRWFAGRRAQPVGPVIWNPVYNSVVSSNNNVTIWQPV